MASTDLHPSDEPAAASTLVEVWADTGGTFTDCLAVDPGGAVRRAKVLSSSAVRGTARRVIGAESLEVDLPFPGADDLVDGFAFVPLDGGADGGDGPLRRGISGDTAPPRVVHFNRSSGVLLLDVGAAWPDPPFAFELRSPEEAPVLAARMLTGVGARAPLPPIRMRLATTRGTNALLERKGAPTALFVTRGFADLLVIGTQQRPDLFTLRIEREPPLHARVYEVPERVASAGAVVTPLDTVGARALARKAVAAGFRVAAISLMNAYRNDVHERLLEEILLEAGFERVSRSSGVSSAIGYLDRTRTTVVNAYLAPVVSGYVAHVEEALEASGSGRSSLHLMTSAGGLVRAAEFSPKDSLLSGPAGGVIGAVNAAAAAGFDRVIAFDMGGTSTDVARFDRDFEYTWSHEVAGVRLLAPALAIASVAAGGGSICSYGSAGLAVGPESAGANPGPACYGAGGPLTITDCNLLLGRIDPESFGVPLSLVAAEEALGRLHDTVRRETGAAPSREELLSGLIAIADERMAGAIRSVSLRRGYDPADYALVVFGGAGGQHGCGVADRLGITKQIVPLDASLLSAWGIGRARLERVIEAQVLRTVEAHEEGVPVWLGAEIERLAESAVEAVAAEGLPRDRIRVRRIIANTRLAGQEAAIPLDLPAFTDVGGSSLGSEENVAVTRGSSDAGLVSSFLAEYERIFGHRPEARQIEVESLRVIASEIASRRPIASWTAPAESDGVTGPHTRRIWIDDGWREVPCYRREVLRPGADLRGPCVVVEAHTSILVAAGWTGTVHASGALILTREEPAGRGIAGSTAGSTAVEPGGPRSERSPAPHLTRQGREHFSATDPAHSEGERSPASRAADPGVMHSRAGESAPAAGLEGSQVTEPIVSVANGEGAKSRSTAPAGADPVVEQLFTSRFERIVEEMGEQLRRTAMSTNVKERLDFSCALLDPSGELVANAPHIPVHLGAIGLCVRRVTETLPLKPGDVVVTNHPAFGGSHLPDISVITPVHTETGVLLGYMANRAHHAEIGGTRPGSMPPDARHLVEEGVTIPPFLLVRDDIARWEALRDLLATAPYPSRAVDENLADLRAQVAANRRGAELLRDLAAAHGIDQVGSQMELLTARSERLLRAALRRHGEGRFTAVETLDDGASISVNITVRGNEAVFDFTGTSSVRPGNLNATPAIVNSAVLYVLRLLIDEPRPLNEGLLRPISIVLPHSLLDPGFTADPADCPAVVGGNTEVSQRLVDTLLKALGLAACSQGTMNNVLWGNDRFGYYETIAGGEGASPGHDGCSAVHTHMTNTRITDAEVLEHRYPVRVERFAIRRGSGGNGRWRGGDGVVREILFLDSVSISVLTQHRGSGPYGMAGGRPGAPGTQRIVRADGERIQLDAVDGSEAGPGDRLVVETPGGGGWGETDPPDPATQRAGNRPDQETGA